MELNSPIYVNADAWLVEQGTTMYPTQFTNDLVNQTGLLGTITNDNRWQEHVKSITFSDFGPIRPWRRPPAAAAATAIRSRCT